MKGNIMKKRVSFKLFFTVIWRGLSQVFQFVAKIFGFKDESTYAKVIWRIFAGCITSLVCLFTFGIFYCFVNEVVYPKWIMPHTDEGVYSNTHISNYIVYQDMYSSVTGRLYDTEKKKVLVSGLDWVVTSDDKDSLAVFSKDGKRGYINRFTGEIEIPLEYSKAWVFSEGLAAVESNKKLLFINHDGDVVIDKDFQPYYNESSYVFKNGYCPIKDHATGNTGLINKNGNWVLEPVYDYVYFDKGFWQVQKDGMNGLYNHNLVLMFATTNTGISISESDKTIEVRAADHIARRYDFEGNILVDFVIDDISNMVYEMDELRNDITNSEENDTDTKVYGIANCQKYLVRTGKYDDYYGLLDRNGKRITDPIYSYIEAIGKDLYLCQPQGVIINDKGEIIK